MIKTKSIRYTLTFAVAAALCLSPSMKEAKASCPSPDSGADAICGSPISGCDADADGYEDIEECEGFLIPSADDASTPVKYSWDQCNNGNTEYCMDPTKQDLFLIVVPANLMSGCEGEPSYLPDDFLYPTTDAKSSFGLGLTIHPVLYSQTDLLKITEKQKAIGIMEDCSTANLEVAGEATRGVPTSGLVGTVYSHVIRETLCAACGGCTQNADGDYECNYSLYDGLTGGRVFLKDYLKKCVVSVLNHEVGHMMALTVEEDRKVGFHWPAQTGAELDQFIDCTSRKEITTCYASDIHAGPDIAGFHLK